MAGFLPQFLPNKQVLNNIWHSKQVLLNNNCFNNDFDTLNVIPMSCTLGKKDTLINSAFLWSRLLIVFYFNGPWRALFTFCWKPHLNRTSGSKVMSNWRILKTIENKKKFIPFSGCISQCSQLLTDSAWSQHIHVSDWLRGSDQSFTF